ncbi:MAG: hypothetical protein AAB363_06135 [Planctomycetota bacterium]|jgi:uncharacterized coiled-coil protein SlyX
MLAKELLEAARRANSLEQRITKLEKRSGLRPLPVVNMIEQLSAIQDAGERERTLAEYIASLEARIVELEASQHG